MNIKEGGVRGKPPQESRDKISRSNSKKYSDFNRENNKKRKKVDQYDLEGNYIKTYDCIKHAEIELNNGKNSKIYLVISGRRKKALGYIWKYIK
jgi:hypothetical protein